MDYTIFIDISKTVTYWWPLRRDVSSNPSDVIFEKSASLNACTT